VARVRRAAAPGRLTDPFGSVKTERRGPPQQVTLAGPGARNADANGAYERHT